MQPRRPGNAFPFMEALATDVRNAAIQPQHQATMTLILQTLRSFEQQRAFPAETTNDIELANSVTAAYLLYHDLYKQHIKYSPYQSHGRLLDQLMATYTGVAASYMDQGYMHQEIMRYALVGQLLGALVAQQRASMRHHAVPVTPPNSPRFFDSRHSSTEPVSSLSLSVDASLTDYNSVISSSDDWATEESDSELTSTPRHSNW